MSVLDQATDYRLAEMRDLFRSGLSELTGKARRIGYGEGPLEEREYGARFRGVKAAFPELRGFPESPGRIAEAIERGRGKLYGQLRRQVKADLSGGKVRAAYVEKPTVPPHDSMTKKCSKCGVFHGRGSHRFHGRGAWLQTHLFPYKANMKKKRVVRKDRVTGRWLVMRTPPGEVLSSHRTRVLAIKALHGLPSSRNPGHGQRFLFHGSYTSLILARRKERSLPGGFILKRGDRYYVMSSYRKNPVRKPGMTKIYGKVLRIEAQKTGKHQCDAECRRCGHRYYHDFKVGPRMYGLPDGSLLIK